MTISGGKGPKIVREMEEMPRLKEEVAKLGRGEIIT